VPGGRRQHDQALGRRSHPSRHGPHVGHGHVAIAARHGEQRRRGHAVRGGAGVGVDPGRQPRRVALTGQVDDRRGVQPRGGDDRDRAAHRCADQRHPARSPAAQLRHGSGDVGDRVAAAAGTRRAPETAQVEQQRPHAVAREVARVGQPAAVVPRVLMDQHGADRARPDDRARQRDAVARAKPHRLRMDAGLLATAVRGARRRGGRRGRGPFAGGRMRVAAAPGDRDQQRCEQSEPTHLWGGLDLAARHCLDLAPVRHPPVDDRTIDPVPFDRVKGALARE
jgi:hypothetical protein